MQINAHPPILDGSESLREQFFGSKDLTRDLPLMTHPFHERRQEDQNRDEWSSTAIRMGCTLFTYLDIVESKGFWETGEWYQVKKTEFPRLWTKIVEAGFGSDQEGAFLNGINRIMEDPREHVLLSQKNGKKTIKFKQDKWFPVANKSYSTEDFAEAVLREIAGGQGVQWGFVTQQARIGYIEADRYPYEIIHNDMPMKIAHAVPLSSYGENKIIYSSGVSGENFGNNGVVTINPLLTRKGFTPLGFSGTFS